MGQRIYRVDPPDVEGDVWDSADAARLVGSGLYSRSRPSGAEPSRGGGSAKRKRAVKPAPADREG